MEELGQKEMEKEYCFDRICELMTEERVLKGKYNEIEKWLEDKEVQDETRLAARFQGHLIGKQDLKQLFGINNSYVISKKTKISPEAQADIENLDRLEGLTKKYLKKTLGRKEILEEDYEKLVENYLLNETNFSVLAKDEERKRTTIVLIGTSLQYQLNLKIKKPSKNILGHDEEDLNKILHRI